jgi:hypothetical protein
VALLWLQTPLVPHFQRIYCNKNLKKMSTYFLNGS